MVTVAPSRPRVTVMPFVLSTIAPSGETARTTASDLAIGATAAIAVETDVETPWAMMCGRSAARGWLAAEEARNAPAVYPIAGALGGLEVADVRVSAASGAAMSTAPANTPAA